MTVLRRRWFSFSLRTLFALVTACAVASPVVVPALVAKYKEWRAVRDWAIVGGPGPIHEFFASIECSFGEDTDDEECPDEPLWESPKDSPAAPVDQPD